MEKIIIFGASNFGIKAFECLRKENEIIFFLDNNPQKWGNKISGIEIQSPEKIKDILINTKIVIASSWNQEIKDQLIDMGAKNISIFHLTEDKVYQGNVSFNKEKRILSIGKFLQGEMIKLPSLSFAYGGSGVLDYALLRKLVVKYQLRNYLEIGTYIGDSLKNVSDICDKCYSISVPEEHPAHMKYWCKRKGIVDFSGKLINEDNMVIIKSDSKSYDYSKIPDIIDLVFIDGDHSYEGILSDTINILKIINLEESFIVWHDCRTNGEINYEALSAINEAMNKYFQNIFLFDNNICGVYIPDKYLADFEVFNSGDFFSYEISLNAKKHD